MMNKRAREKDGIGDVSVHSPATNGDREERTRSLGDQPASSETRPATEREGERLPRTVRL